MAPTLVGWLETAHMPTAHGMESEMYRGGEVRVSAGSGRRTATSNAFSSLGGDDARQDRATDQGDVSAVLIEASNALRPPSLVLSSLH